MSTSPRCWRSPKFGATPSWKYGITIPAVPLLQPVHLQGIVGDSSDSHRLGSQIIRDGLLPFGTHTFRIRGRVEKRLLRSQQMPPARQLQSVSLGRSENFWKPCVQYFRQVSGFVDIGDERHSFSDLTKAANTIVRPRVSDSGTENTES